MSEPILKKRKVWVAVLLSFLLPGVGHIYCGRIVKAIAAMFLMYALIPAIFISALEIHFSIILLIISCAIYLMLGLYLIIDSGLIAKYKSENYVLKDYNKWYIYILLIILIGSICNYSSFYFRDNVLEKFRVPTAGSYPTIVPHDKILVNKTAYITNNPKRGDLVVFINPENRHECFEKRVIGIAGDTIEIKDNHVYVNGEQLKRQALGQSTLDKIRITYPNGQKVNGDVFYEFNGDARYKIFLSSLYDSRIIRDFNEITVPKNYCFVLGDNRNVSLDSRYFGSIPLATIKGKAEWIYRPAKDWSRFGRLDAD